MNLKSLFHYVQFPFYTMGHYFGYYLRNSYTGLLLIINYDIMIVDPIPYPSTNQYPMTFN